MPSRNPTAASFIVGLLLWRSPSDIARRVVSIIVDAVNRIPWAGADTDVCKKREEVVSPFVTDGYSSASVVLKPNVLWVCGALNHTSPGVIFWYLFSISRRAMLGLSLRSNLSLEAPTRLRTASVQMACSDYCGISTLTVTSPLRTSAFGILCALNNSETAKDLIRQVLKIPHDTPPTVRLGFGMRGNSLGNELVRLQALAALSILTDGEEVCYRTE